MSFYKQDDSAYQVRQSPRSGEKCIVCGDPNSNCTSGTDPNPKILFEKQAPSDKVMVLVPEDIIEERQLTPGRSTKVVLAKKGTYVTKIRAVELGLRPPD